MKKLIIIGLILLTVFLFGGSALAQHRHSGGHGHVGIVISPPPIWIGPPAIIYRGYYPPPYHYPPNYYEPYRVWVPGHWEEIWGPTGWEKVWISGYWRYNP